MPRTKERTPELRDHVLEVAVDLLAREGVPAFTARAVAVQARTSTPALYELFGDKAGLVRAVFFEGWRRLGAALRELAESDDPRADLEGLAAAYRAFVTEHRTLGEVMLSRPFSSFDPTDVEREGGAGVRELIVHRVRRCVDAGLLRGDPVDIAHGLVALVQGLAAAENARRLGSSKASIDRRWRLATTAMLDGFAPEGGR